MAVVHRCSIDVPLRGSSACLIIVAAVLLLGAATASASTYDVGRGQPWDALAAVPWQSLQPGDVVRVHPGTYHEKLWLTESGTERAPIRIQGVPAEDGSLPVIDGQDADSTVSDDVFGGYPELASLGVVGIARGSTHEYGYRPSWIELSDLDIRGGRGEHTYQDATGAPHHYAKDAAGVWIGGAAHITLEHLTIQDNANGLFAKGLYGAPEGALSDLLVFRSHFLDNGVVDSDREHQIYTEGAHVTFEANHLDRLRPGALGNNLKDRSAGTTIRANWIEGGGHLLDLVDAQDSADLLVDRPDYETTDVEGNVLIAGEEDAVHLIHYGGDTCGHPAETDPAACPQIANYRDGLLRVLSNTVIVRSDRDMPNRARISLLDLDTDRQRALVVDNIIRVTAATPGHEASALSVLDHAGVANVQRNWLSPRTSMFADGTHTGSATETGTLTNAANDPGFADEATLALRPGGQAVDAALPAPEGTPPVSAQYVIHQAAVARSVVGAAADLGAFELGLPPAPIGSTPGAGSPTGPVSGAPSGGATATGARRCRMPDLRRRSFAAARRRARSGPCLRLRLTRRGSRSHRARVRTQSVRPGTRITPHARVVVRLR